MAYFLFLIGLILYFLIHSTLAESQVKSFFFRLISPPTYRIFYNVFSVVGLLWLFSLYLSESQTSITSYFFLKILGTTSIISGFWILKLCLPLYDWNEFLGIKKSKKPTLVRTGIAGQVRHPLYLGTVLVICGFCFLDFNLWSITTLIVSTIYIYTGIFLEEKKLVAEFGDSYEVYQKEVPKLFQKIRKTT